MNIELINYDNGESYTEINDATSSQISAYSNSTVIRFNGEEFHVMAVVMDVINNCVEIHISENEP